MATTTEVTPPSLPSHRAVLLVAHRRDEHADRLGSVLEARGHLVDRVSQEDLPARRFNWSPEQGLAIGRASISCVAGIWRRPGSPATEGVAAEYEDFADSECRDALEGALSAMPIRWLTAPGQLLRAERKLYQLRAATELGLPVPRTLVSNRSRDARRFIREVGDAVVKPVRYGLLSTAPPLVAFTRAVTAAQVQSLNGVPVILQARIMARLHLRLITVGGRTFVSELQAAELDWRENGANHDQFRPSLAKSHPGVARDALRLARRLGAGYTAQDWIIDTDGRPWFLEANPNGQWLFLDAIHEGAITDAIATKLVALAHD